MKGSFIISIIAAILILGTLSNTTFAETAVERVANNSYPSLPEGDVKVSCFENGEYSSTCPVLKSDGFTLWAFSYKDNRSGMMIVKYDDSGNLVEKWEKSGARYIYDISVDASEKTVSFWGQADKSIVLSWNDLGISSGITIQPPVIEPVAPPAPEPTPAPEPEPTKTTQEKVPPWIKDIFAFYVDGSIDEDALINALKWLINEGIIQIE